MKTQLQDTGKFRHGGPYDRGSSDAYYGRRFRPHFYIPGQFQAMTVVEVTSEAMTEKEISEYKEGFFQEEDKKDWGSDE